MFGLHHRLSALLDEGFLDEFFFIEQIRAILKNLNH